MNKIEKDAFKYAVKNAYLHNFKANTKAVAGKLKALNPEKEIKELFEISKKITKKVNSLDKDKIKKQYLEFEKEGFNLKPKEKEGLPKLEWADKEQVITRYAPNPNGPFHLGNARAAVLSYEYARKYHGKFILRFDDTDPKIKKPIENAEKIFLEDLNFLKCKVDEIYFASDRLEIYYEYMKKLIEMGKAYVCSCESIEWKKKISQGIGCNCRNKTPEETMERFNKMLTHQLKEGKAVLRIKTDLSHKDPSVRDWWLAKIVDAPIHPKIKDKYVWPSYNLASAIDDHLLGITLIIRGQEHQQNETKQRFLYDYFGWKYPHTFYTGRIKLENAVLSTSKIKEGIESGKYIGWDDPRLGTIRALRRRGFKAETLIEILLELGVKSSDTTIEWKTLTALNKKYLPKNIKEMTLIQEPLQLKVDFCPKKTIEKENKIIELNEGQQRFIIDKKQLSELNATTNSSLRLRKAYNIKLKEITSYEAEARYTGDFKAKNTIDWFLGGINIKILMPNATHLHGMTEKSVLEAKENELIHLKNFGYIRIEQKSPKLIAVYAHK